MTESKSAVRTPLRSLRSALVAIALGMLLLTAGPSPRALGQAANADQKPAAPSPDVLILANGDQLTGKLLSEANGTVTFHSDMAGDLKFTWDKIKPSARPRSSPSFNKGNTSHVRLLIRMWPREPSLSTTRRSRWKRALEGQRRKFPRRMRSTW